MKLKYGLILAVSLLSACAIKGPGTLTEVCTKETVPVVSVPAPPKIDRPDFPLDNLTPDILASQGEMAKRYVAAVKTLEDYSIELEAVIADYQKKHDEAQVIANQIKSDIASPVIVTPAPTHK